MKNRFYYFRTFDGLSIRYCAREARGPRVAGSVVLLGGRSEFIEKYNETVNELAGRGFDVYSADWRGQGLSGRVLDNPHKGYVKSFDDYLSDLTAFMEKIVFPDAKRPLVVLAHSMGGHILLRYLHENHERIDAAVLLSPMIDIRTHPLPPSWMRFLVRLAVKIGYGEQYSLGSGDYVPGKRKFENNRLTSDPDRFSDTYAKFARNPGLALGGSTYQWLAAAFDSIDVLMAPGYADRIRTPVLIASSVNEQVVSRSAQQRMCRSMQNCVFADIPNARHEILREIDPIRDAFWELFDAFVLDNGIVMYSCGNQ